MKKLVIAGLMTIALSLCAGLAFAAEVSAAGAGIAQWTVLRLVSLSDWALLVAESVWEPQLADACEGTIKKSRSRWQNHDYHDHRPGHDRISDNLRASHSVASALR